MRDLVEVCGISSHLQAAGVDHAEWGDFEAAYDKLATDSTRESARREIETALWRYFDALRLPDTATMYDRLLLSLRKKDLVATFNWDPLLLQAYRRVTRRSGAPSLAFLHGNVGVGYCEKDHYAGNAGTTCPKCLEVLSPSPLLYPVRRKDYRAHSFLDDQWKRLESHLECAYLLTIIGYSAPATDVDAREMMLKAWRGNEGRELAEIEIVDIRDEAEVLASWSDFTVHHHAGVSLCFERTFGARYARRSCEAFAWATLQNDPWYERPIPSLTCISELRRSMDPLIVEEIQLERHQVPLRRFES